MKISKLKVRFSKKILKWLIQVESNIKLKIRVAILMSMKMIPNSIIKECYKKIVILNFVIFLNTVAKMAENLPHNSSFVVFQGIRTSIAKKPYIL